MQTFKAICTKNNQKVELIVRYNSLEEVQNDLHKQGYAIINIQQIEAQENQWKVFYFEILLDGAKKSGQIQAVDIFKAYIKLIDNLHYNVVSIYDDINNSEEEKKSTTSKIQASYRVYKEQNKEKEIIKEVKIEQNIQKQSDYSDISGTFVGKELNIYYTLLDKVLIKIETILNIYWQKLTNERKIKLQELFITIKQLKNSTNIDKLRLVSESALMKIGELELELLHGSVDNKKQQFIKETNELLRKFGSSQRVQDPETDTYLKIKRITTEFFNSLFSQKEVIKEEKKIDSQSFVFYKNLRELNIYKEKLRAVQKEMFFATILWKQEKKHRLSIKKRLIIQNIQLIERRIKNIKFSYSSIIKGVNYYRDIILFLLKNISDYILYIIFFYSFFFIFIQTTTLYSFNYSVVYLIVILWFFSLITKIVKNIPFIGVLLVVFFFFLQINF